MEDIPDLTPLALAVWLMDDGGKSRRSVYLNTQQSDQASQLVMLRALRDQFGIEGTLNSDRCYTRIRISVAGTARLADVVWLFVRPELRYKLPQVAP